MSISKFFIPNFVYSQIKDRKHIEQYFHSVASGSCPRDGTWGAGGGGGGVKNLSVGICDGAPSPAHSCISLQTVWTQIRPDKMSGLIWVHTV